MGDDIPRRGNDQDDESFADALDDMFGPPATEQPINTEPAPSQDAPPPEQITSYPHPPESAPVSQPPPQADGAQRPLARWFGIGCAGVLIFLCVCMIILGIIGALTDSDSASGLRPITVVMLAADA